MGFLSIIDVYFALHECSVCIITDMMLQAESRGEAESYYYIFVYPPPTISKHFYVVASRALNW